MKSVVWATILIFIAGLGACAADSPAQTAGAPRINLDARDVTLQDAIKDIAEQSGASIVVDPKAQGKVSANLNSVDLSQALDVVTQVNNLTWKKLQFARPDDPKVTLDQLKSAILALASMPVMALAVHDPATNTSAMFARNMPASPDLSAVKLPEGYKWVTVHVVLAPEEPVKQSSAATESGDQVAEAAEDATRRIMEMAALTSEQRRQVYASEWMVQMSMTPEARRGLLRDRMSAMFDLDPTYREQLHDDMRQVFRDIRRQREQDGVPMPRGMRHHRD